MTRPVAPLPTLDFKPAEVPTVERLADNPFTDVVAALASDWDTEKDASKGAQEVVIPFADLSRMKARLSDAAKKIDKSARTKVSEPDKNKNVTLTFWLKPKMKRQTAESGE